MEFINSAIAFLSLIVMAALFAGLFDKLLDVAGDQWKASPITCGFLFVCFVFAIFF